MESILTSIKKLLGIPKEYIQYDTDIIIHINSVFTILNQMGIGPSTGFSISDDSTTWGEFITEQNIFDSVKTYVYLKVRLIFDPPTNSAVMDAIQNMLKELEWRLDVEVNLKSKEVV